MSFLFYYAHPYVAFSFHNHHKDPNHALLRREGLQSFWQQRIQWQNQSELPKASE